MYAPPPPPAKTGFTLIELSIVLVIIGLVIGGVLVGRDLIKGAETRRMMSEVEEFNTVVNVFRVKYNCLPGDCATATNYFGINPDWNCIDTAPSPPIPRQETCNGDGNGTLDSPLKEHYLFWQHLASAGIIIGKYVGYEPGGNNSSLSLPRARFREAVFWYASPGKNQDIAIYEPTVPTHILTLASANFSDWGFMTTSDLFILDNKYDDGMAATGNIQALGENWTGYTCNTTYDADARYDTTVTDSACAPIFKLNF